jgi:hypothetical protein
MDKTTGRYIAEPISLLPVITIDHRWIELDSAAEKLAHIDVGPATTQHFQPLRHQFRHPDKLQDHISAASFSGIEDQLHTLIDGVDLLDIDRRVGTELPC